jgi:hypothetical protein
MEAHDGLVDNRRGEVVPCGDAEALVLELQQLQVKANLARAVYVPALPRDVEALEQLGGRHRTSA